jgi:pilus assembly protein CpaB
MDRNKILLIFAGAWISAAVLTFFLYRSTRAPREQKTVSILAASRDLPAGTRLQKGDVKLIRVLEGDAPKAAIADEKQALDRATLFPLSANEPVTAPKLSGNTGAEGLPATIEIGKRAIAVPINDSSGVAGLIQPRAHVDVLFTKTGSMAEALTTTILEDVTVLAIGRTTEASNTAPATTTQTATRPATLLVTPEQARALELAKNQGKISLALRNPLDQTTAPEGVATAQSLYSAGAAKKSGPPPRTAQAGAPPKAEPPKPPVVSTSVEAPPVKKRLVDVYRGDKHTQEAF